MNEQDLEKKYKKFTISFLDSQKAEFLVDDFTEDELKGILSQFFDGKLMVIRNLYANPKNVNYIIVDDLEEE